MVPARTTKTAPAITAGRVTFYIRAAWLAVIVLVLAADLSAWATAIRAGFDFPPLGADRLHYVNAALRWLDGDGFYLPEQLAGPYDVWTLYPVLYPPNTIPLFLASAALPAVLWWLVPLGIVAWAVWYHRPHLLAVVLILGLLAWPATLVNAIYVGNPSMWAAAALALATTGRGWAAPFVLLKPTLAPFALWGLRGRGWWVGLSVFAGVSALFAPLWVDYLTALRNAGPSDISYQLWHIPLMLAAVVAYLGERSPRWMVNWRRPVSHRQNRMSNSITSASVRRGGS